MQNLLICVCVCMCIASFFTVKLFSRLMLNINQQYDGTVTVKQSYSEVGKEEMHETARLWFHFFVVGKLPAKCTTDRDRLQGQSKFATSLSRSLARATAVDEFIPEPDSSAQ